MLGLAPLVATAWIQKVSRTVTEVTGLGAVVILLVVIGLGLIGWRPPLRTAENNFWSLNALAVQPGYALRREALRHLTERAISKDSGIVDRARLGAISCARAGIEPRVSGSVLSISPIVVLFAIFFWTLPWGISGTFIGVPITLAILTSAASMPTPDRSPICLAAPFRNR
jgi:AI-2E family transporter